MTERALPPSDPPERSNRLNKAPLPPPILVVIYLMMTAVIIGPFVAFPVSTAKSISYSDFIQMARGDQVAEVVIDVAIPLSRQRVPPVMTVVYGADAGA